jgi:radical SAM superfamily enzyme YgiQ (UPF0313 family)
MSADRRMGSHRRLRVLVVNAFLDPLRLAGGRPRAVPQSLAPVFLAGVFSRDRCEVRAVNEQASGPLLDPEILGWPDLLVLTGLTCAFDRMLHLTAYARTLNPRVVVAAGGPAIRALPVYSRRFFDFALTGDVEDLAPVVGQVFHPGCCAEEFFPRFDLAGWFGRAAYVESSRNCNYRCSFCSLTSEGHRFEPYPVDFVRRQILAQGRKRYLIFLDNNFYGGDRGFFQERIEMLTELYEDRKIVGWGALVTNDFFECEENLALARRSGCGGLFSGVESFEASVLRGLRKLQNTRAPQVEMIRRCLLAGVAFLYGIILDFATRTLEEIDAELDYIVGNTDIPMPNYFTPVIPLLGTPYFHDCVKRGLLLPDAKLRDFDTTTLVHRPRDPLPRVAACLRDLPALRRYRSRIPGRMLRFLRKYHRRLELDPIRMMLGGALMVCAPRLNAGLGLRRSGASRTYVTTTEPLDPVYTPAFPVDPRFADHFRPTMITDASGALNPELRADLEPVERRRQKNAKEPLPS